MTSGRLLFYFLVDSKQAKNSLRCIQRRWGEGKRPLVCHLTTWNWVHCMDWKEEGFSRPPPNPEQESLEPDFTGSAGGLYFLFAHVTASYWIGQSLFAFRTYISNLSVKGMYFELNKEALHIYLHLILAYFTSHLCLISNIVTIYLWVINKCENLYWISIILVCKNNGLCSKVLNSSKTTVDSHSTSF